MKKDTFRKVMHFIHLWLGLISGLIVTIVAITGCIYAFEPEFRSLLQSYQNVEIQHAPFLSPSALKEKAMPYVYATPSDSANVVYGVTYETADKAAKLAYNDAEAGYTIMLLNPYTGAYIHQEALKSDFFRIILAGHRSLWLPYSIGHQIVGWGIFAFLLVIVSGIVVWIPKRWSKRSLKNLFTFTWKGSVFKKSYDLHRVLGGYAILFALVFAITGLTWSFPWFGNAYYRLLSGGKALDKWAPALSDTTATATVKNPVDQLWQQALNDYPIGKQGSFMFDFPQQSTDAYRICYNPDLGTYYKRHFRFFDQNTLKELKGGGLYGINPKEASTADTIYRMTYDLHVGAVGGFLGRLLMFCFSFIIATLPITGVVMWWKRKKTRNGQ